MSLPRKDHHVSFNYDIDAAMKVIANLDGDNQKAWIEKVITDVVTKRVRSAMLVVDAVKESGGTGIFEDSQG